MACQWKSSRVFSACSSRSFSNVCFRVVELESYINAPTPSLLFDLGPKISRGGQRFSPPGDHCGLCVSTEPLTAGAEFAGNKKAWMAGRCPKHVVFDMSVELTAILDLTYLPVRRILKISQAQILTPWNGYSILNGGAWPVT